MVRAMAMGMDPVMVMARMDINFITVCPIFHIACMHTSIYSAQAEMIKITQMK